MDDVTARSVARPACLLCAQSFSSHGACCGPWWCVLSCILCSFPVTLTLPPLYPEGQWYPAPSSTFLLHLSLVHSSYSSQGFLLKGNSGTGKIVLLTEHLPGANEAQGLVPIIGVNT